MRSGTSWSSLCAWTGTGGRFLSRCVTAVLPKRSPPGLELATIAEHVAPADYVPLAATKTAERAVHSSYNLIDEMLAHGRFALLLRPQLIGNLSSEQVARTQEALNDAMCLVPPGEVHVCRNLDPDGDSSTAGPTVPLYVEAYYLDRYQVTNRQFQLFVAQGGYEQMAIWDPEIWPAVLDFVDQTGHPGPRYWRHGRYPRGEENHPVVGASWYEAAAYARWTGKRLPTDAEWVKAACWPVAIPGHPLVQRRYPWGEAIDRDRANLWGSGSGRTVPVDNCPAGVSVGGASQLIGNVWEWIADELATDDPDSGVSAGPQPKMQVIRGGAFDTYLDCQSTCHFQSGDRALARKHNIGFRCAISLCDIAAESADETADGADAEEMTNESCVEART